MLRKVAKAISAALEYDIEDAVRARVTRGRDVATGFHMYRSLLSETQQQAYDTVCAALAGGRSSVTVERGVLAERDVPTIVSCIRLDHPELYWLGERFQYTTSRPEGHVLSLSFDTIFSAFDRRETDTRLDRETRWILATAASLDSDPDRVKLVHDYLTHTVSYGMCPAHQTAYAALVLKRGLCAAYSRAFQYCLQKLGISVACLQGRARNEDHMWNLVRLDDDFYAVDVTWDDPVGKPKGTYVYKYFNVPDNIMERDHARGALSARLPRARGKKYSFDWFGTEGPDFSRRRG